MDTKNSQCIAGWMHRYQILDTWDEGVVEICPICRTRRFFHKDTNNFTYLSYHLRSALQNNHPKFAHEYGK